MKIDVLLCIPPFGSSNFVVVRVMLNIHFHLLGHVHQPAKVFADGAAPHEAAFSMNIYVVHRAVVKRTVCGGRGVRPGVFAAGHGVMPPRSTSESSCGNSQRLRYLGAG